MNVSARWDILALTPSLLVEHGDMNACSMYTGETSSCRYRTGQVYHLASFPGSSPCAWRRKIRGQRAWCTFARDTRHVDVTAVINLSVTSQLERAYFCTAVAAIHQHREDYTDGDNCGESYLAIQTPVDSGRVQYKLQNLTYSFQPVR